jgi:predicted nuclease of predicted toxin-antitoxin system
VKLPVDANLSPKVSSRLREAGHDAEHVFDHGLTSASDQEIAAFAIERGMTIVSADSDFATLLALGRGAAPSLVLFRSADRLTPDEQAASLVANLAHVEDDLADGAVVSIARGRLRMRRLPLR